MQQFQGVPIISDQINAAELSVLLRELEMVINRRVVGDVVELGCFEGTSALFEARLLKQTQSSKVLWLYDSFEGLPEKHAQDNSPSGVQFRAGKLKASKKKLIEHFKKAGLPLPHIIKGWFSDLSPQDLPEHICFAFLDGDYFTSILDSLKLVWPKLSAGAVVVVDDYQNEALPGASKAVDEWARLYGVQVRAEKSLAIIRR